MKTTASALLALLLVGSVGHATPLDEQIVNAINAGDTTNLLSMLTPEARPSEAEAWDFIQQVHMLFGTLIATGRAKDMTGVHNAAVLGKEFDNTTIQDTREVKSSQATDAGLTLIYADSTALAHYSASDFKSALHMDTNGVMQVDTNAIWQMMVTNGLLEAGTNSLRHFDTNALWQIRVEGNASPADIEKWAQWSEQEAMTQPARLTSVQVRVIPQAPDVDKDGNIILATYTAQDEHGTNRFVFSISKALFDRQPAWDSARQPVPLEMDKALQITLAWIQKQSWAKQFKGFDPTMLNLLANDRSFNLLSHDRSYGCWFYMVDLNISHQSPDAIPAEVLVLLDGSVVEPKPQ